MDKLNERIGVCSWSLQPQDAGALLADLKSLDIKCLQLAIDPLRETPRAWASLAEGLAEADIKLVSGQFGAIGEDYTTPQTIRRTGGFVPTAHWDDNLANVRANVAIAKSLGITRLSTHAGFIPQDPADPMADVLLDRLRTLADLIAGELGGELLLETGQETPATLHRFLESADRANLGVNFDPANMLLYHMGDPLLAVKQLLPFVRQVHIKDAVAPDRPGTWGEEVVVGTGQVDWPVFLGTLEEGGYTGDLVIEREAGDQRVADITTARDFITNLLD